MQEILFNEAEHKYYDNSNINYTSVTTLIGKYTETFDTDLMAMFTALKEHGFRVKLEKEKRSIWCNNKLYKLEALMKDSIQKHWYAEVIARWDGIREEACKRGNDTHNELEDNINMSKGDYGGSSNLLISPIKGKKTIETKHDLDQTNLEEKYPLVYNRFLGFIQRGFSIFAEKKIHLPEFGVAGMIDVPIVCGKYFAIDDWKTNKAELHDTAGYYKKVKIEGRWIKSTEWVPTGERFKYPLDMLEASKLNIYALQLSTYSYMMEQWGYIPMENHLKIIHFPLGEPPRLIRIPYLRDEVIIMLNHHKYNNLKSA